MNFITLIEKLFMSILQKQQRDLNVVVQDEEVVAEIVKLVKSSIDMIPNLPPAVAAILKSDEFLTPLAAEIFSLLQVTAEQKQVAFKKRKPKKKK